MRKESLALLEKQAQQGHIDLFYGDETKVCESGYVPYGWQFCDEQVEIPASRGASINCFGLLTRDNRLFYRNTKENINADFIIEVLDEFSLNIDKPTVVVLDNASPHKAKKVKEIFEIWKRRGLFIFFLPPYSPQLNIIERLWKEIKEGWLRPQDYISADNLFYALDRVCAAVGSQIFMKFSDFDLN